MPTTLNPANRITKFLYRHRCVLGLFLVFFIFNVAIVSWMSAPISIVDEYGVLSAANWFSGGTEWGVKPGFYFGYAHSIFYAPLFLLFDDIYTIYAGALCINAFFTALVPVFCYKILSEIFGETSPLKTVGISVVVGLFPYFTLYSKMTQNETLLFLILFICVYLVGKNLTTQSKALFRINSVLLGFLPALCYAAHGMGLVFPAALCLCVLFMKLFAKKDVVNYALFFGALLVFFFLEAQMKDLVEQAVYASAEEGLNNTLSHSLNRMLPLLFSFRGVIALMKGIAAKLHYLSSSTFGLFPLACVLMLWYGGRTLRRRTLRRAGVANGAPVEGKGNAPGDVAIGVPQAGMLLFSFLALAIGLLIPTLNHINYMFERTGTYFIYSRYFEYFVGPILLFCLYYLLSGRVGKKVLLKATGVSVGLYVVLSLLMQRYLIPQITAEGAVRKRYAVYGTMPFSGNSYAELSNANAPEITFSNYKLLPQVVVAILVLCLFVVLLVYKKEALSLCLVGCMFVYVIGFDLGSCVVRWSSYHYPNYQTVQTMKTEFESDEVLLGLYDEYQNLCVINTGEKKKTKQYCAQLTFTRYTVTNFAWPEENAQEKLDNYIILCNKEKVEIEEASFTLQVFEADGMTAWLCGEDIIESYRQLITAGSPEE